MRTGQAGLPIPGAAGGEAGRELGDGVESGGTRGSPEN